MARRPNQVSMPNPEFGVDFDASARAMHQSASKGSLMVHEKAFSMLAAARKSLAATLFERNTMLKTLKRKIALVAVAALGAGALAIVSAPVANAAVDADELDLVQTGSTLGVKNAGGTDTAAARAGIQTIVVKEAPAIVAADAYDLILSTGASTADAAAIAAVISGAQTITAATAALTGGDATDATVPTINAAADNGVAIGKLVAVVPGAGTAGGSVTTVSLVTASLAAGTYTLWADPTPATAITNDAVKVATITVVNAGAPASISWAQNTREISATAVDYTVVATPKDASGVSTVLVGAETMVLDIAPQTGVAASQVDLNDFTISANEITATTGTSYDVTIDGDASVGGGGSGTTVAGTTYTIYGQLVNSGAAIGAPSSATYTRVSNSAGLNATISYWNGNTSTATAVTALSSVPAVAAIDTYVKVVDNTGAMVKGVTVGLAFSGLTGTIRNTGDAADITTVTTGQDGFSTASFRPKANAGQAGTGTTTASISAGVSTLSATLPLTVTAYGATAPVNSGVAITANNGNGITAGATANLATSSLTVTSFTVKVSGIDASKVLKVTAGGTATTPKVNATAAGTAVYPVADAAGSVTLTATVASATADQTLTLALDAAGDGTDITVTITFATAAAALTTVPATATTSFVAVSSVQDITATVADQFKNAVTGGSVLLTNTSVPAGITAQTAGSVNLDSAGKAVLKATIGATAGNYVFTIQAKDANGGNVGTASTVTFAATTDGAPGSVTLTAGGTEAGLGTYRTWISTNGVVAASAGNGADNPVGTKTQVANATADAIVSTDTATQALAKVGDYVVMTVSVKNAAGTGIDNVKVAAKGSAGVYIATAAAPTSGTTALSTMTATDGTSTGGGVATFYVVATKAGSNTVTFTVGSKTAVATFTAETGLLIQSIARDVKLSSSSLAVTGNAITQVTATVTDAWGNPASGVALTGTITGAAGRFAGGGRTFAASTDAAGQLVFEVTANAAESGSGTLTVAGVDAAANITTADFRTGDQSTNVATLAKDNVNSITATLAVTAAVAAANPEIATVKADVKAVSDTVATLSKAVTTIQSSVTELTSSFASQIKSLTDAIAKISKAIAALQRSLNKKK